MNDLCKSYAQALDDLRKEYTEQRKSLDELRRQYMRLLEVNARLVHQNTELICNSHHSSVKFQVHYNGTFQ